MFSAAFDREVESELFHKLPLPYLLQPDGTNRQYVNKYKPRVQISVWSHSVTLSSWMRPLKSQLATYMIPLYAF